MIECPYWKCPWHCYHSDPEEGPFCAAEECWLAKVDTEVRFESLEEHNNFRRLFAELMK